MQIYKRFTVGLISNASYILCMGRRVGIVMKLPENFVLGVLLITETRPFFICSTWFYIRLVKIVYSFDFNVITRFIANNFLSLK